MDKDFSPAPLDDQDLEALFAAAQRDTPELDPKFLAQLQAQAAAALPQQPAAVPQATAARDIWEAVTSCRANWWLAGRGGPGHGWGGGGRHRSQPAGDSVGHHQRLFPDRESQRAFWYWA